MLSFAIDNHTKVRIIRINIWRILMKKKARTREVVLSDATHKHLLRSAAYFGCTMGTIIDMLLDAVRLAEMPGSDRPRVLIAIDSFEKYLSSLDVSEQNYLFKD